MAKPLSPGHPNNQDAQDEDAQDENPRVSLVECQVSLGALSLFVPFSMKEEPSRYSPLTLPVNVRSASLGNCAERNKVPVSMSSYAMGNLSGEAILLLATQRSSQASDNDGDLPASAQHVLDSEDVRSDCLVSLAEFDPAEHANKAIRVSKLSDLEALASIFCKNRVFDKKSTSVQELLIDVLLEMDRFLSNADGSLGGSLDSDSDRSPYIPLFNRVYREKYGVANDEPIEIGIEFQNKMPNEHLFDVLVASQEEYDTKNTAAFGQSAKPVSMTRQQKNVEQCATWHGCHALFQTTCKVFPSLIDGNHRLCSTLMSHGGFNYDKETSVTALVLSPESANVEAALNSPRIKVSIVQPTGTSRDCLQREIREGLLHSKTISDLLEKMSSSFEPVHKFMNLLLHVTNDTAWLQNLDLSNEIKAVIDIESTPSIEERFLALAHAACNRRGFLALLCVRFYGAVDRASDNGSIMNGVDFFQEIRESPMDGNLIEQLRVLIQVGETSSSFEPLHSQGAFKVSSMSGELTNTERTHQTNYQESLRNALFGSPWTSSSLCFFDIFVQNKQTGKLFLSMLQKCYHAHANNMEAIVWGPDLIMEMVNLAWWILDHLSSFLKHSYEKLGIQSRNEKKLALAYIQAVLYADIPYLVASFVAKVGLSTPDLRAMEPHLRFPKSVFPFRSAALTILFLCISMTRDSDKIGDYPQEMKAMVNTIKLEYLRGIITKVNLKDPSKSSRPAWVSLQKEWKEGRRNPNEVKLLSDLFQAVMSFVPGVVEDIKAAKEMRLQKRSVGAGAGSSDIASSSVPDGATGEDNASPEQEESDEDSDATQQARLKRAPSKRKQSANADAGADEENINPQKEQDDDEEEEEESGPPRKRASVESARDELIAPSNLETASNLYPIDDIDGLPEEMVTKLEAVWSDAAARNSEESVQEALRTALRRLCKRSLHLLSMSNSEMED